MYFHKDKRSEGSECSSVNPCFTHWFNYRLPSGPGACSFPLQLLSPILIGSGRRILGGQEHTQGEADTLAVGPRHSLLSSPSEFHVPSNFLLLFILTICVCKWKLPALARIIKNITLHNPAPCLPIPRTLAPTRTACPHEIPDDLGGHERTKRPTPGDVMPQSGFISQDRGTRHMPETLSLQFIIRWMSSRYATQVRYQ